MAKYTQGTRGKEAGGESWAGLKNVVYGATEAPRVHGLTGARHLKTPRFKNHYIVRFQYTEALKPFLYSIDPKQLIDVTHRVRTIDAPRIDIDTDTLNQYNKPRIVPLKVNYQPITITFWDDRSDISNNFWNLTYEFYFRNGRRVNHSQYTTMDSDITHTDFAGIAKVLGYDNYGYDLQGKLEKKNLFAYISLYLIQNASATRIDLINPYMQSMQHDQFSQDQSSELAQNTVTWGYENVVYYNQRPINAGIDEAGNEIGSSDQELLGILKGDQNIFNWQDNSYWMTQDSAFGAQFEPPKSKANPRQSLSQQMASSRGGPGSSSDDVAWGMANSFAELQQVTENARMRKRDKFSSTEADTNWLKDSQGITKSNINREFSEELTHLASNTTDFHGLTVQSGKAIEVATEVDSFAAIPTDGNALDTTETNSKKTGSAQGSNNIPTTQPSNVWINPNTGKPVVAVQQTNTAQSPNIFTRAVAEYNAMSPAEKAVVHKNAALKREKAQNDRR